MPRPRCRARPQRIAAASTPRRASAGPARAARRRAPPRAGRRRSEEHTSELQSQSNLVCRLLLEKKKQQNQQDLLITKFSVHQSFYRPDMYLAYLYLESKNSSLPELHPWRHNLYVNIVAAILVRQ